MEPISPLERRAAIDTVAVPTVEARLAAIVESADDAILGASPAGVIETWNPAAERIFGYAAAEAIGQPLAMLAPSDRTDGVCAMLDLVRRGGPATRLETARRRKDGSLVDVCLTAAPIAGGADAVLGFAIVARDITSRRHAEEALRRSEERYRLLVQACTEVVWCTDADGNVLAPRPSWEAYTGQRLDEYSRWGWLSAFHPDDRERMRAAWDEMRRSPGPTTVEARLWNAPTRRYRYCIAHGLPVRNGSVHEWVGTITDVDHRRRSEEAARFLSEATKLLSSSLDYMQTLEQVTRLAVSALADTCCVHFEGDGVIRVVADAHRGSVERADADCRDGLPARCGHVEEVVRTGRTWCGGAELPDGREALQLCVPMCARGRSLGVLCFTRLGGFDRRYEPEDVAVCEELGRRAAIAVDNARLYGMAQGAARAREEFLTCAAHELRTPLVPLKLAVQALLKLERADEGAAASEQSARLLESVERGTARLGALVEELLDISHLVSERLVLSIEPVDLAEVVAGELSRCRSMLAGAGCEVSTEVSGPASGRWDRDWLGKAFARLLSNAAKYGRGHPIEVRIDGDQEKVRLVVCDHGIGISAEEHARIFERFERAVSARHYGGFGFGLWSVRRIVEAHGGSVGVQSAPGVGATFTLELPRSGPGDAGAGAGP